MKQWRWYVLKTNNPVNATPETSRVARERVVQEELLSYLVLEQVISSLNLNTVSDDKTAIQYLIEGVTGRETRQRAVSMDAFVRDLRKEINIVEVDANNGGGTNIFSVTMRGKQPGEIAMIVNTLIDKYIAGRTSAKRSDTEQAIEVLATQVEKHRSALYVATKKLNMFRSMNAKYLTSESEVSTALQSAKMRLIEASSELTQARALAGSLQGTLSAESPIVIRSEAGQDSVILNPQDRLYQLEGQLASLQVKFRDEHPQIRKTKAEIAKLKRQIAMNADLPRTRQIAAGNSANPEFQRLRSDLTTATAQEQAAVAKIRLIKTEIADLEDKSAKIPNIVQMLSVLEANEEKAKQDYTGVNDRLMAANVNVDVLKTSAGTHFSVLDPAQTPDTPLIRSRLVLHMLGIIGSVMLGIGAALSLGLVFPRASGAISLKNNLMFYGSSVGVVGLVFAYSALQFVKQMIAFV